MSMIFYSTHHHYFQTETNTFKGPTFVMTEVDGRAWWAAVYGVEQSRTRLKRLSSSSSSSSTDEHATGSQVNSKKGVHSDVPTTRGKYLYRDSSLWTHVVHLLRTCWIKYITDHVNKKEGSPASRVWVGRTYFPAPPPNERPAEFIPTRTK